LLNANWLCDREDHDSVPRLQSACIAARPSFPNFSVYFEGSSGDALLSSIDMIFTSRHDVPERSAVFAAKATEEAELRRSSVA
jgi:hypothetical protein